MSRPDIGTVLRGDDGLSVVVAPGTSPLDALLTLIEEEYGGERLSSDNPVVVAALDGLTVDAWTEYSPARQEADGVGEDDDYSTRWWGPNGDGSETIHVLSFEGNVYDLGDRAHDAALGGRVTTKEEP